MRSILRVAARRAWSLGEEGPRTVRSAVLLGALLLDGALGLWFGLRDRTQ